MRLLLLSVSVIFLLTACGGNKGRLAPRTEADLGVIINLHQNEVSTQFSNTKPISKSKILPFTEVMDASVDEVKKAFPNAIVTKNSFIKSQSYKSRSLKPNLNTIRQFNELDNSSFTLEDCSHAPEKLNPVIQVVDQSNLPRFLTKESKLTVTSRNSRSANLDDFKVAWVVVPPLGSNLESKLIVQDDLELNFDMPGVFEVNLFIKQGIFCNITTLPVPITDNSPMLNFDFEKLDSAIEEQFSESSFAQIEMMGVRQAQVRSRNGEGMVVAVLDSGVNYNSPLLAGKIWKNLKETANGSDTDGNDQVDDVMGYDFVNDDAFPMDDNGHGSHVAGLIAGSATGIAPNATIMPVKVMNGLGLSDTGTILSGLVYAILNEADVINMSLGGEGINPQMVDLLLSIYSEADKRDIIIVAAAGNGDLQTGRPMNIDSSPVYPASLNFKNILTVGASDLRGDLTYYSNFGVKSVDVLALGGMDFDIEQNKPINELLVSAYIPNPKGVVLNTMMGTSMAAPITAGMAAFLRAEDTNLTAIEVNNILIDSVDIQTDLEGLVKSAGVVNLESALNLLSSRLIN